MGDNCLSPVIVDYKNHRGEVRSRQIIIYRVCFGTTYFHREPQWILVCFDVEKNAPRDFALKDCNFRPVERDFTTVEP